MNHTQLTSLLHLYQGEQQPFRKVHRMIDLFESIIKMHTVVIISEYVNHNKLSDTAKGILAQGLRTPSLGTWQFFSRELSKELHENGFSWTFPDFFPAFVALEKALNNEKTNAIALRNSYAHGATPSDEQCQNHIIQFEPFLKLLLQSNWLLDTTLNYQDNKVWLVSATHKLCLHPILIYRPEGEASPNAFFNDIKNNKIGLINYPLSKHYKEAQFYHEFHEYLPLDEWKKTGNNDFYQRIEELTETFKGRIVERQKLLEFVVNKNKGFFSIQGNPGIGKSALIAQFFKDLKANKEIQNLKVIEYFIRRGTTQAQANYLFDYLLRSTDECFPAGKEIRAKSNEIWDLQYQLFSKWRLFSEKEKGKKLLFLIDGLDEGVENNLVNYLPRENFEGILIIYGSRPGGHKSIDELWSQLPVEHHTKLDLLGLGKEDIRALIYEVANKYEIDRESVWIDAVQQRSQGNPLYLKLLCDAMENGEILVNDIGALPKKIDEYYKAILDRYAKYLDGDALLSGLFTFAASKDYLTMEHLRLINKLGEATVQRIASTIIEVLFENPTTKNVLDYQLFHESFRDYLLKEKGGSVQEAAERIIDFCSDWKNLEGTWEQRYTLQYYAIHLSESKKEARGDTLMQLIYDNEFVTVQKKVLNRFNASNGLYRLALKKANVLKRDEDMMEAALCLVDLKYEEANEAPQIVEMVANGEIDLAMQRIESFGGPDKEGLKRKFILYMLCLMELTLLESKDKPFSRTCIEKLLNHLDEHLPIDYSVLDWGKFFPSYLMLQLACEWTRMDLDFKFIYMRANSIIFEHIIDSGNYNDIQFDIMIDCAQEVKDLRKKCDALIDISTKLAKQGKSERAEYILNQALVCAREINKVKSKCKALGYISSVMAKQGRLREALQCAREIDNKRISGDLMFDFFTELVNQGEFKEALIFTFEIANKHYKDGALKVISSSLAKVGKFADSIEVSRKIVNNDIKCRTLKDISTEIAIQYRGDAPLEYAIEINNKKYKIDAYAQIQIYNKLGKFSDALEIASGLDYAKNCNIRDISLEMTKQGKFEEAFQCAKTIDFEQCRVLFDISSEMAKMGSFNNAIDCASQINDRILKNEILVLISSEIAKLTELNDALECAREIDFEWGKTKVIKSISSEMAKQQRLEDALFVLKNSISNKEEIDNKYDYYISALIEISAKLFKQGRLVYASSVLMSSLLYVRKINYKNEKIIYLKSIAKELFKQGSSLMVEQGSFEEALIVASEIDDEKEFTRALRDISSEMKKQGKLEEASYVLKYALEFACKIDNKIYKDYSLELISLELTKQGSFQDALIVTNEISSDFDRNNTLSFMCSLMVEQGSFEEALIVASEIDDEKEKVRTTRKISTEMAKQLKEEDTIELVYEIENKSKNSTLNNLPSISTKFKIKETWDLIEKKGLEIPQTALRQEGWQKIASESVSTNGWKIALLNLEKLQNQEAREFYLKGWVKAIKLNDIDEDWTRNAMLNLAEDSDSIEHILQLYAQNELFFGKPSKEKINRLNKTLNIQWALDIIASFPKEENSIRSFSNLIDWIDQIEDEDDRDQVSLWAKQVAKGKMNESEFEEKIKEYN
jgi:hypothetical protein